MEEKIDIIKEIVKHHPGYGTQLGYSWYQGGMRDTGAWKWEVLIDEPIEHLKDFLKVLKEIDQHIEDERMERARILALPDAEKERIYNQEIEERKRLWLEHIRNYEACLMWGIPKKSNNGTQEKT